MGATFAMRERNDTVDARRQLFGPKLAAICSAVWAAQLLAATTAI